jgi:hypothetical protein
MTLSYKKRPHYLTKKKAHVTGPNIAGSRAGPLVMAQMLGLVLFFALSLFFFLIFFIFFKIIFKFVFYFSMIFCLFILF